MTDKNKADSIGIYGTTLSNLILIAAAGLATGTALLQLSNMTTDARSYMYYAIGAFFAAMLFSFFSLCGLTGQATKPIPDINKWNVRLFALLSIIAVFAGFILLTCSGYATESDNQKTINTRIDSKLEICSSSYLVNDSQRLACYDSLLKMQIATSNISAESINSLSEEDRIWVAYILSKLSNSSKNSPAK